jgi:hypothetical protein
VALRRIVKLLKKLFDCSTLNRLDFFHIHIHFGLIVQFSDRYHLSDVALALDVKVESLGIFLKFLDCLINEELLVGLPDLFKFNKAGMISVNKIGQQNI